jgi:hypothetical protein
LVRKTIPYRFSILIEDQVPPKVKRAWEVAIERFLRGTSKSFLAKVSECLLDKTEIPPFYYRFIQDDLEILAQFFEYGPHRNRKLKRFHGIQDQCLAQEKIDDLLVTYRLKPS